MWSKISFLGGFFLVIAVFGIWQNQFLKELILSLGGEKQQITSVQTKPRVSILGEVTTLENDFDFGNLSPEKEILAKGAYVYDLTQKRVLLEKNAYFPLQAASTIKIVTAAVALDKGNLDEEMVVNYFPTTVGESSMYLTYGEKFTLEELLYGMLVVSANDAAETIAQGLAGKREIYVSWMNEFAKEAGALKTYFKTPSGLDEEGQETTAYDLSLLGRSVFDRYPEVLKILSTREKYLPKNAGHEAYFLKNKLLILDSFPIIAGKPGLGEKGMMSLIALIQKDNRQILVSLIQTSSIRQDLNYIYENY
jgi:serine-type D-Ala-D-Ala carboxypeptidase (penicillin-binding protein 5/6)